MADDNRIDVNITASTDELRQGLTGAAGLVDTLTTQIAAAFAGMSSQVRGRMGEMSGQIAQTQQQSAAGGESSFRQLRTQWEQQRLGQREFLGDARKDELAYWQDHLKDAADGTSAHAAIVGRMYELEKSLAQSAQRDQANAARQAKGVQDAAAKEQVRSWQSIIQPIQSSFERSISGMIMGTQTLQQAVSRIGQSILSEFVNLGVKKLTNWIATELGMTAASLAGVSQRGAMEEAAAGESIALSIATAVKDIAIKAYQAAAGAYAAIAAIPYAGPVLAPAAAAGALAAVFAFGKSIASAEGGWDQVPGDQIAQLHKNEMVLSAPYATGLRNLLDGFRGPAMPGMGGSGAAPRASADSGGTPGDAAPTVVVNFTNQGGALSERDILQHSRTIAKAVAQEWRYANPRLRPA
jgi:hypothetical protein